MLPGNDGKVDGKCSFQEALGVMVMDLFVDNWLQHGHNCTSNGYDNYGHFDDGTGAIGSMANQVRKYVIEELY